jgi:adenylate cyclase
MDKTQTSKSKSPFWTIKLKLILINSLVIVFSLGAMIFLATRYFLEESQNLVTSNLEQVTDTIGSRVKSDFTYLTEKIELIAATMDTQFKDKEKQEELIGLFFKEDKYFLMVGIFSTSKGVLEELNLQINKDFLRENDLSDSDFKSLINIHSDSFLKASGGQFVLTNTSPGIKVPSFALSVPYGKDTDRIIIAIMHLNRIRDSFEKKNGIMETFLINDEGIIVAHHNESMMFSAKDELDSKVVEFTLKNQLERGQTRFQDKDGLFYFGSFRKIGVAGASVISQVSEDKAFEQVYNIQRRNIYILGIALCIAILIIYNFSITITNPLLSLVSATNKIKEGDFHPEIKPVYNDEVGLLTTSFLEMASGLEEREKVKNILGNMVDPVVVEEAMRDFDSLKRGSERQITAFFSDVASFSTISEKLTSVQLAALLNEYLGSMTLILKKHNGVLDKYIGDAIVGIFNAPVTISQPALSAARSSLEMIEKLKELREYWKKNDLYIPEAQSMDIRIGLNSGPAKVGFMGTDALASYTMMGDTVNLAARLEAAGKDYGVNILISESVKDEIESEMFTRLLDVVRVKGKNEPVKLYELISRKNQASDLTIECTSLYEKGFQLYLDQEWSKAIEILTLSEKKRGSKDKAVRNLVERCEEYMKTPPSKDWDGVFTRTHK